MRRQVVAQAQREGASWRDRARAEELAGLRQVPLGNALFTRASFEAEYGPPGLVGDRQDVDLGGTHPELAMHLL